MGGRRKHTVKELEYFIQLFNDGKSLQELQDDYGLLLSQQTFNNYYLKYQMHGLAGIEQNSGHRYYSQAFKEMIVKEHLNDHIPIRTLARKYKIPGHRTVKNWVFKYTEGEKLKERAPNPEVSKMKGKTTSYQDKLAIVQDIITNGLSHREAADKYHVSYNNVYAWVQKYRTHGSDGLIDSRGRRKPSSIQTAEEKLRTENAALKSRNEYLETENAALKKLKEVERELMLQERNTRRNMKR